jgi:hypothetical protein
LQKELEDPSDQNADGERCGWAREMFPNNRYRKDNKGDIQQNWRGSRQPKDMETVQDGHGQRRHPNEQDVWEYQAVQIDCIQLDLILSEHGEEPDKERRKDDPEYGQSGQNDAKRPK